MNFEEWVQEHQQRLVSYAYLVCHDRTEALDITQDVLATLYSRWDALTLRGQPLAYARRAITNAAIDRWRRDGRHRAPHPPSDRAVGSDESARATDATLAWQLCASLPPAQRAVIALRYWEDLTHKQIGDVLQMPEATVRSHAHRAVVSLQTRIAQEDLT